MITLLMKIQIKKTRRNKKLFYQNERNEILIKLIKLILIMNKINPFY
jgi:hypothetical protein